MRKYAAGAAISEDAPPALEAIVRKFACGVLTYAAAAAYEQQPGRAAKLGVEHLQSALAHALERPLEIDKSAPRVHLNPAFLRDTLDDTASHLLPEDVRPGLPRAADHGDDRL